jgi:hypothetical protein
MSEFCPYLGGYIGSAIGLEDMPLYECRLAEAYWQGKAGDGKEFPFKRYCRVNTAVEQQAECLQKTTPIEIYNTNAGTITGNNIGS